MTPVVIRNSTGAESGFVCEDSYPEQCQELAKSAGCYEYGYYHTYDIWSDCPKSCDLCDELAEKHAKGQTNLFCEVYWGNAMVAGIIGLGSIFVINIVVRFPFLSADGGPMPLIPFSPNLLLQLVHFPNQKEERQVDEIF